MKTKTALNGSGPLQYGVRWDARRIGLLLDVPVELVRIAKIVGDDSPWYLQAKTHFDFSKKHWFSGDLRGTDFGISGAIRETIDGDEETKCFSLVFPKVWKQREVPCENCSGSGLSEVGRRPCLYCRGTKRKHDLDWDSVNARVASLGLLLSVLGLACTGQQNNGARHLDLRIGSFGRNYVGGVMNESLASCIYRLRNSELLFSALQQATEAMKSAHNFMWHPEDGSSFDAQVNKESGALILTCPGSGCFLYNDRPFYPGRGRTFSDQGAETALQTLTLLAGVVAFAQGVEVLMSEQ